MDVEGRRRAAVRHATADAREGMERPVGTVVVFVESDGELPAVLWAADRCRRTGAALRLVARGSGASRHRTAVTVKTLRGIAAIAGRNLPAARITTGLLPSGAAAALVDLSAEAAMIVVPDTGDWDGQRDLGAVCWALASRGRCPLIVWRPAGDHQAAASPVVVGVDGSPVSVQALRFALQQASLLQVTLVVVMAWSDVYFDSGHQILARVTDWKSVADDHSRMLAGQVAGEAGRLPEVRVEQVLTHDRPIRALLKAAAGAQLLVVGSHGRGGFPGMLLGSVSRALIDYSPCSLAVVRPQPDGTDASAVPQGTSSDRGSDHR